MYQIRKGVFETNSSSTHSITFMSESEYDAWKNGEVYLNDVDPYDNTSKYSDKKFVTKDEAIDILSNNQYYSDYFWNYYDDEEIPEPSKLDDDGLARCRIYTFENYMMGNYLNLEVDINSHITDADEKIYAVCAYGRD